VLAAVVPPAVDPVDVELAAPRELAVHVRDLELAAARRLERVDDLEDVGRKAVEPDDRVARRRRVVALVDDAGLLDDVRDAARLVVGDDPENFGVVVYGDEGEVADIVEKAGVVDLRFDEPPTSQAVVGLYCYPADVFDVIATLSPSGRGELEITDVNRHYALVGRLEATEVGGWWEDAGKHWQHLADIGRRIDETGANKRDAA